MASSDLSYKVRRGIAKAIDGISRDLKKQGLSPFTKEETAEIMEVMISHFEQNVTKNYKDRKSREESREKCRKKEKEENNEDGSENTEIKKEGKGRENTPNFKFKGKFAAECAHFILVRRGIMRKRVMQLGYPAPNPRSDVYRYFPLYGVDAFRATLRHAISRLALNPRLFDESSSEMVSIRQRLRDEVKSGFNKLPEQEAADLIRSKCDVPAITVLEQCTLSDIPGEDLTELDGAGASIPTQGAFSPQAPSSKGLVWLPQAMPARLPEQPVYVAAPTAIVYQNPHGGAGASGGSDSGAGRGAIGVYSLGGMGGSYVNAVPNMAGVGGLQPFPAPVAPGPMAPGMVPVNPAQPIAAVPVINVPGGMVPMPGMAPPYMVGQRYGPGTFYRPQ